MQRKYRKGGRGLVSITSYFIRQFCLPNTFINLFKDSNVATIVNWICGAIFIPLAYILTGSWYNGEIKSIGSFGFLVNYIFLTSIFILITKYVTNLFLILLVFVLAYIILYIIERKLLGQKFTF